MWLLPVVAGAIVPHAPLLIPELAGPEVTDAAVAIGNAIRSLALNDAEAIVLLSPHARAQGVYRDVAGDLSAFGIAWIDGKFETSETVRASLGLPFIDGAIDHGVLVPALVARWEVPIVAVGIDSAVDLRVPEGARIAVVASINGSAGLSPRAPLTEIDGAKETERRFVAALENDVGSSRELVPPGSCGGAVMHTFGAAFEGRRATVLAHEAPVGVGYFVAEIA